MFLSKTIDKCEQAKQHLNSSIYFSEYPSFFVEMEQCLKKEAMEHNVLQLVEDSITFTDFVDVKSKSLESM